MKFLATILSVHCFFVVAHANRCLVDLPPEFFNKHKYIFIGRALEVSNDDVRMEVAESFGDPVSKVVVLDFSRFIFWSAHPGAEAFAMDKEYMIATNNFAKESKGIKAFKPRDCDLQDETKYHAELINWLRQNKAKR